MFWDHVKTHYKENKLSSGVDRLAWSLESEYAKSNMKCPNLLEFI
jgi:hypothetical protein